MLQSDLPQWVRDRRKEMAEAYRQAADRLLERCEQIKTSGHRNEMGKRCDRFGTIDEYRLDAKYCAGQAARLQTVHYDELPPDCQPMNPQAFAEWAWRNPFKDVQPVPLPKDAMLTFGPDEMMDRFTQREAEALILCIGLMMTERQAAEVMGTKEEVVKQLIYNARKKFGPNVAAS